MTASSKPRAAKPNVCFACGELFMDSAVGGSKIRHGHHVIPRAAGGSKGPVVDICNEDHDLTHRLAEKILHGKLTVVGIKGFAKNDTHADQLTWLVTRVVIAFRATKDDPNKRVTVTVTLTPAQASRLDTLGSLRSRRSRTATLAALIDEAYNRDVPVR